MATEVNTHGELSYGALKGVVPLMSQGIFFLLAGFVFGFFRRALNVKITIEIGRSLAGSLRRDALSSGHFERPSGDELARSRKRLQVQCFRAARPGRLSGHFERPSGAEQARCRKRRQVRCFRGKAELSRAQLNEALGRVGVQGLLRKV